MDKPEVNTQCGRLRGSQEKSPEGLEFLAFKGIPYAKPPIEELRFKDPIPPEPWTNIRDALNFGPMCAQTDRISKIKGGSDDCLYLNVYTKLIKKNVRRPVMFWIHGGGFIFGSGDDFLYGPNYLMKKDIVLVTINYRLGILGFMNLNHELAPGNQGLKDQVMALEWVRDNIANFGGDPENVTIFGESAGGASVHYLTLSPLSKGLFHKAISQSGVAINPFASVYGDTKQAAYRICKHLGMHSTDPIEIIKFLQTIDALKLVEVQDELGERDLLKLSHMFGPSTDVKSQRPFMPVPIRIAAQQATNVPYLLGHNSREGFGLIAFEKKALENINSNFIDYLNPWILELLENSNQTIEDLKRVYFNGENISKKNVEKLIDLVGDMYVVQGVHEVIKTQVEHNSAPTYFYQFTYDEGYSIMKLMCSEKDVKGTAHMDELFYLFSMKFLKNFHFHSMMHNSNTQEKRDQILELWTNFVKTGNPTCVTSKLVSKHWEPVTDPRVFQCMNIKKNLFMEDVLNIEERLNLKKNKI